MSVSIPAVPLPGKSYLIYNGRSGTVLDVSGSDGKTVIGYPAHGGDNQIWTLAAADGTGENWTIQVKSSGLYLACESFSGNGKALVVRDFPFHWRISIITGSIAYYKISLAYTPLEVTLANRGSTVPGTPVILQWILDGAGTEQTWKFSSLSLL